ncbi:hypothetical protein BQ8482_110852 [Mesorhizobium delmotii]|uniref:Uncharacterized protein n=1 Tax=Mesorhizobium delmotii TaxID=1631247 RepID=A0A2P9ACS0_9HYPH|nr:hypothetical protein BQ8482_110852 [Mesorhizobium delmotii]
MDKGLRAYSVSKWTHVALTVSFFCHPASVSAGIRGNDSDQKTPGRHLYAVRAHRQRL